MGQQVKTGEVLAALDPTFLAWGGLAILVVTLERLLKQLSAA
jgi:hypothetical protein